MQHAASETTKNTSISNSLAEDGSSHHNDIEASHEADGEEQHRAIQNLTHGSLLKKYG
jgi:hypothetical protein